MSRFKLLAGAVVLALLTGPAQAIREEKPESRFDRFVIPDPSTQIGFRAETPEQIPDYAEEKAAWDALRQELGGDWEVHIDRRSGTPLLVEGSGIRWFDPDGPLPTLAELEARARQFVAARSGLLKVGDNQLVLNEKGSAFVDRDHVVLSFDREVGGVPVEGQRFLLYVTRGNLVAFGAQRWGRLHRVPEAAIDVDAAREILYNYMGIHPAEEVTETESGTLVLVPASTEEALPGPFQGRAGEGVRYHLAYRFTVEVEGDPGIWLGKVDAVTGEVIALSDTVHYAQVKGSIFPEASDGVCPSGCEAEDYPMPFADVNVGGVPMTTDEMGNFACTPAGAGVTTTLSGPYVTINDVCGSVNEGTTCDADLDLGTDVGTDCAVAPGSSAGNTRSSRMGFFHLNRNIERAQYWLPSNTWLQSPVELRTNVNANCNATWGGRINMYTSGGGCRNTGELIGVLAHEWGHGLDQNDGGGFQSSSEGYADVAAFMYNHLSCVGRGFRLSGNNCGGYGDACLDCDGIRDQDWDKHASHTPATPQGFWDNNCGGGGPCGGGGSTHCEGHIPAQAVWDLANRDLPAAGFDAATSWQITEKLWFKSRLNSGGDAYNCALPDSDGCNTGSWFETFRIMDDDDGNLANGTPHAAAIFAAFDRHNIACGAAADASNQDSSSCPGLATPTVTSSRGSGSVSLSWSAVTDAANYLILRNDLGCDAGYTVIDTVAAPTTTYVDTDLPNAFTVHYRVQAQGANTACESAVSACQTRTPLPNTGEIRLNRGTFACNDTVEIELIDLDLNASPGAVDAVQVTVTSTSETVAETVALTETDVDTSRFEGTISIATGSVVNGDGILQVSESDVLTVTYRDADDGTGSPVTVFATATAVCSGPAIFNVRVTDVTDESAIVRWETTGPADSRVDWGLTGALGNVSTDTSQVTSHAVTLSPIEECDQVFFTVTSNDALGYQVSADVGGSPFRFNVSAIAGLFRDGFETATGWTLEGEWEIDAPQGLGNQDPSSAFAGTNVLGVDLTGLGNHPGDYEGSGDHRAISPVIDASALAAGEITFRRWLNVFGGADSSIEVWKDGVWNQVWIDPGFGGISESSWSSQTLDISAYADGNSTLQIAFRQTGVANPQSIRGGWNVDRFAVRSANDPPFAACGGCLGAPGFAGATGAADVSGCEDTGVEVTWDDAASWGTGSTGTYSIYRDVSDGFTPSTGNRIATGVTGNSYVDTTAPNGVTQYYLVIAENDETCSTGPNNGGLTDANAIYVAAADETTQPAPGDVGSTLRVANVNDAHVQLTWDAIVSAAAYRVFRADDPQGPFTQLGEVAGTVFDDLSEIPVSVDRYYVIKAVDSCGNEGP